MTTFNYSSDILYSNISGIADGDVIDLDSAAELTIDQSTVQINIVYFDNIFQSVRFLNDSTTTPIIVRANGNWSGNGGTIRLEGLKISLGTADGTSGQTFQVPQDSLGNYPSSIGWFWLGTERWTQIDTLSGLYGQGDVRSKHFTYDNTTGIITCGDGTNGSMPTGDVQIENIYFEHNGGFFFLSGSKIVGRGGVVFISSGIGGATVRVDEDASWGVIDHNNNTTYDAVSKHRYGNYFHVGTNTSVNTRLTLGQSSETDNILFQSSSSATAEVLQSARVPMYGTIESRAVYQRNTTSSRVRIYNDGGDVTLKIYQGSGEVLTPYGGNRGIWRVEWTNGYKRTDTSPYKIIHDRYVGDYIVPSIKMAESNPWTGERQNVFDLNNSTWEIGSDSADTSSEYDMIFPSDMQVDEVFNTSGFSNGTINRLIYNGTASSGSRDFNTWTPKGWRFSNVMLPNDTSHGFQPEDNQELHFVSCIGQNPAFGRNMSHSTIIKNSTKTSGQVWFLPHPDGDNAGMLNGVESDLVYSSYQVYYAPNTKTFTRSGIISGSGIPTAWIFTGNNLQNFTFEYKVWRVTDQEPANYNSVTLNGFSADATTLAELQSAMSGFTTDTQYFFKYTVEKNNSDANLGAIAGFYFEVPLDPNYIWVEPPPELTISAPNVIDGSRVVVINYTKSTKIIDQYGQEIITVPSVIDNSVVSGGNGYSVNTLVGGNQVNQVGDIILLKINWQSGTQAKIPLRIFALMTESGITVIDSQEDDEIHNNMVFNGVTGLDGATVDVSNGGELSANFTNVEINVNDPDNTFDCRRGIAWWRWINTTEQGALIYDALGLAYLPDEYNVEIRGPLKIKNSKIDSELTITNGIWKHYQGESIVAVDSYTIVWVPNDRLYSSNLSQVEQIKQTVDQYLDTTISSRSTLTAQQVWEFGSRTLTSFGTLISDIWSNTVRTLTIAIPTSEQIADAVWDEEIGVHDHNSAHSAGKRLRQAGTQVSAEGRVVSGNASSFATDLTKTTNSFYSDQTLVFVSGNLEGQCRIITSYNGSTKTLTFDEPFSLAPEIDDEFEIKTDHVHSISQIQNGLATSTEVLANLQRINEILINHNNPTYYYGQDGTTRVKQNDAYFISLRSVDGSTEIRRINVIDENGNPTSISENGGYN